MHGYCIGGGVDLIAACDIRLASADAVFSVREAKVAIVADLGSLQRLPAIINAGHLAELAFTGKDITAERAKEIGLVNDVATDAEGVLKAARALAAEIAANSPIAVQGTKAVLAANEGRTVAEGLDYVATWNAGMLASDDLVEAMTAFMEKRTPKFTGRWTSHERSGSAQRRRRHQRLAERSLRASSARTSSSTSGATSLTMSSAEPSNAGDVAPGVLGLVLEGRLDQAAVHPADVGHARWYEGQFSGQRHGASGARSRRQKRAASPDA